MSDPIKSQNRPSALYSVFAFKCPRCRQHNVFEKSNPYNLKYLFTMYSECPNCGQPFELEVGFYWGAMYVGYALSSGISLVGFFLLWQGFKMNGDLALTIDIIVAILLMPFIFRLSRSIWLHAFFKGEKK